MSFLKHQHAPPGTAPGTYDRTRPETGAPLSVAVVDYSARAMETREGLADLPELPEDAVRWIRVTGKPTLEVLEQLRELLDLDPLALEDIVTSAQRPKFTHFDRHELLVLSLPDPEVAQLYHQLSICVVDRTLVPFLDRDIGTFEPIELRLGHSNRLRAGSVDFLLYAIVDLAVDLLFPRLERAGADLDALEAAILEKPSADQLAEAHAFRRDLLVARRVAWATREVVSELQRHVGSDSEERVHVYLQDVYDHIVTAIDIVETHRDVATTLIELYLSLVSNRMNDIIKVLTIIATVFIPPTFIVGVYGMNFDRGAGPLSMPELGWPLGYVAVMGFILASMTAMLVYFRRKGWL